MTFIEVVLFKRLEELSWKYFRKKQYHESTIIKTTEKLVGAELHEAGFMKCHFVFVVCCLSK